jgi:hypothetical protein
MVSSRLTIAFYPLPLRVHHPVLCGAGLRSIPATTRKVILLDSSELHDLIYIANDFMVLTTFFELRVVCTLFFTTMVPFDTVSTWACHECGVP